MISRSGGAIGAAVDAVQCACGYIMSSELIMHLSAKPRLKGKFRQKLKKYFVEVGTLIRMVYVSTSCDLPVLRYSQFKIETQLPLPRDLDRDFVFPLPHGHYSASTSAPET